MVHRKEQSFVEAPDFITSSAGVGHRPVWAERRAGEESWVGNGSGIKRGGPTLTRVLVAVSVWAALGVRQS